VKGDPLANAYVGLALGAPFLGMFILSVGMFFGKDSGSDVAWWATVVAFPRTNSDRS
jgi:hypothetical protein